MITTLEELGTLTNLSEFELQRLILRTDTFYKSFMLPCRYGKARQISSPAPELKSLQRWLLKNILRRFEVHQGCIRSSKNARVEMNMRPQSSTAFVLKASLPDLFRLVSRARVEGLFKSMLFCDKIATALARLTTFRNSLPQGAPTSQYVADLICRRLDRRLSGLCGVRSWSYKRSGADIVIGGEGRLTEKVLEQISLIVREEGFSIRFDKRIYCKQYEVCMTQETKSTGARWKSAASAGKSGLGKAAMKRIAVTPAYRSIHRVLRKSDVFKVTHSKFASSIGKRPARADLRALFNSAVANGSIPR